MSSRNEKVLLTSLGIWLGKNKTNTQTSLLLLSKSVERTLCARPCALFHYKDFQIILNVESSAGSQPKRRQKQMMEDVLSAVVDAFYSERRDCCQDQLVFSRLRFFSGILKKHEVPRSAWPIGPSSAQSFGVVCCSVLFFDLSKTCRASIHSLYIHFEIINKKRQYFLLPDAKESLATFIEEFLLVFSVLFGS